METRHYNASGAAVDRLIPPDDDRGPDGRCGMRGVYRSSTRPYGRGAGRYMRLAVHARGCQPRCSVKSDQESSSNVTAFRPRKSNAQGDRRRDNVPPHGDVSQLIDISRYELPRNRSDDFRARTAVNIAALVLLVSLAAVAAIDVVHIEKIERFAPGWQYGFSANVDH